MGRYKQAFRDSVDSRVRDSLWAYRSRRDLSVATVVALNVLGLHHRVATTEEHLQATMSWLCAAQDATGVGAVAAFYDVRSGSYGPPYPETTGYIVPTFINYAEFSGDQSYSQRALMMADWLLSLQLDNGAFPIGPLWPDWERAPIVFDTGQIIHGLVSAHNLSGDAKYLRSARRAGDWLVDILGPDGSWNKFTSLGLVHTYNVRTAWGLVRLAETSQDDRYLSTAVKNLEWSLAQQDEDGWFRNTGFRLNEDPLTHTIAYTIEGLLESGMLLKNQRLIDAARLAADALMEFQRRDGYLRARYGTGWHSDNQWSCLTGNAQMAMIWFTLFDLAGEKKYLDAAYQANRYLKQRQTRFSKLPGVSGGVAGSYPIYLDYEPYRNLNWAAKFFADSLLLEARLSPENGK